MIYELTPFGEVALTLYILLVPALWVVAVVTAIENDKHDGPSPW